MIENRFYFHPRVIENRFYVLKVVIEHRFYYRVKMGGGREEHPDPSVERRPGRNTQATNRESIKKGEGGKEEHPPKQNGSLGGTPRAPKGKEEHPSSP